MIADFDVYLAMVFLGLSYSDRAGQSVSFLHVVSSVDVEYYILPVSVWSIWGSAESNLVLEVLKFTVEPSDEGTGSCALVEFKLVLR